MSDSDLMALTRSGNRAAYAILVERHQAWVLSYFLRRLMGDEATANDLMQQSFLRIWEKRSAWRGTGKFSTYLYTIVHNNLLNWKRFCAIRREESINKVLAGELLLSRNSFQVHEQYDVVLRMLPDMTRGERVVLVLSAYAQLSEKQIARVLGQDLRSVQQRLIAARAALKECMMQEGSKECD